MNASDVPGARRRRAERARRHDRAAAAGPVVRGDAHRHLLPPQARAPAAAGTRRCAVRSAWPTSASPASVLAEIAPQDLGQRAGAVAGAVSAGRSSTATSTTAATRSSCRGRLAHTGAARMGARGALRVGAGLVTVASPPDALAVNAAHLTAIMLLPFEGAGGLARHSRRPAQERGAARAGAGRRRGDAASWCASALASGAATVLDADAHHLVCGRAPTRSSAAIAGVAGRPVVLTPHEGEFRRLFPRSGEGIEARACARGGAAIGADRRARRAPTRSSPRPTAAPPSTTTRRPGWRPPAPATCSAASLPGCWRRACRPSRPPAPPSGCTARRRRAFGPGLIAEDLPERLPEVLRKLQLGGCADRACGCVTIGRHNRRLMPYGGFELDGATAAAVPTRCDETMNASTGLPLPSP